MTRKVLYETTHDADLLGFAVRSINRRTGAVTREVLYESQCMDHPKVNPLFAGRPTRFAYFNASFPVEDQDKGAPPQARPDATTGVICPPLPATWLRGMCHLHVPQLTPVRMSGHYGACCVPLLMPAALCSVCA